MDVQYIQAGGLEYAVLPRIALEALLGDAEDRGDIAAAHLVQARLAIGAEELLPAAFVDRMLLGEHPLKLWREHRGLTAAALAKAAGVSQSYLSELESGKKEGTVSTLQSLALVLRVSLEDILP
jgi:DNA-binding XRE family transcriptional regulator